MENKASAMELYTKGMEAAKRYNLEGYREAETFLKEAIEAGSVEAMFELGKMYCGIGSAFKEAMVEWTDLDADDLERDGIKLIERAAEAGLLRAQIEAALIFDSGYTVEFEIDATDEGKAAKWYEMAARSGDADCAGIIGCRYREGTGVRQDLDKALYFLELAASRGSDVGAEELSELRGSLKK